MTTTNRLRAAACAVFASAALAGPCVAQGTARAVAEQLASLYPGTRFGPVTVTPWPGVFEVAVGGNIAYVDSTGRYFLFGHLFDMKTQRDLTAERSDEAGRVDFSALPLADALKEVRGTGARVVAIFSDPDCPHCRRLENEIRSVTDVTLYTFVMPIPSLHPEARAKAIAVWCAADQVQAWHSLMWDDQAPPSADCAHPVDRNIALGERLGITGTPTLIAITGQRLAGAASAEQIEAWLERYGRSPREPAAEVAP